MLLCSCAFDRGGVSELAPYTWTVSFDGTTLASGETTEACGWSCTAGWTHGVQAELTCARGESTVVVAVRCDEGTGPISTAFLDGCRARLACGRMALDR